MEFKLILDRFEEDKAVLKTEDGKEEVIIPKSLLPDISEGAFLNFDVKTLTQAEEEKRKTAKDILNEILQIEDGNKNS